jgi:hypothetical protein
MKVFFVLILFFGQDQRYAGFKSYTQIIWVYYHRLQIPDIMVLNLEGGWLAESQHTYGTCCTSMHSKFTQRSCNLFRSRQYPLKLSYSWSLELSYMKWKVSYSRGYYSSTYMSRTTGPAKFLQIKAADACAHAMEACRQSDHGLEVVL